MWDARVRWRDRDERGRRGALRNDLGRGSSTPRIGRAKRRCRAGIQVLARYRYPHSHTGGIRDRAVRDRDFRSGQPVGEKDRAKT